MDTIQIHCNVPFQNRLKHISKYIIYLVIALGTAVLIGWTFDFDRIKRPISNLSSMNPTTAILFIFFGFSFLCLLPERTKKFQLAAYLGALTIFIIVIIRILNLSNILNIPIDRFIFSKKMDLESNMVYNRMAPITAICFLLNTIAIIVLYFKNQRVIISHFLSLIVILFSLLSILGYIYRVQSFYGILVYIPMAIHTALGFLLISIATLFTSPDKGIMKHLTSVYSGSITARFLIPAAIIIPILLGYLRLLGHWHKVFTTEFGVTILMLSIIAIFVLLIWTNSISLNKKDAQRKVAEQKLEANVERLMESEEKFQKAFQASAAGMSITRLSDGVYLDVNDTFVQMTGYSKEELIGHTSIELGMVVNMKKREEALNELRQTGSIKNLELSVHHKSGKILEILSSIETIVLKGEKYALNIIFDITERKKVEEQLETANKELESFSYSVSHDLRTPLRAINSYSQLLEKNYDNTLDERGKNFLKTIHDNVKKMSQLIDDLLSFSKLKGKTINKTDLNINNLVKDVVADLTKMTEHSAQINIGKLDSGKGDLALIRQVFINLISNAIKYSSKKEKPIIEITSEIKGTDIIYTIKDNGEGFNMAYAHKLFNVFQRLHGDYEFEGTGLGLAIVQRIINKHEGKVWAEAEVGLGAKFSFSLPLK